MSEYVSINTKEIDRCLELLRIKNVRLQCKLSEYDQIVAAISQNWKGRAAESFMSDATGIRKNLGDAGETLKMLNDVLAECREVIEACDRGLGEFNRDPQSE